MRTREIVSQRSTILSICRYRYEFINISWKTLSEVNYISFTLRWIWAHDKTTHLNRDHYGNGLSQWETMLHCKVVSHWLSPYPEWSLPKNNPSLDSHIKTHHFCKIHLSHLLHPQTIFWEKISWSWMMFSIYSQPVWTGRKCLHSQIHTGII